MILKKLLIKLINTYQIFISPMLGNNCRYYPSCSEYAKTEFELNSSIKALVLSTKRILTCNQLFKGGIDYPIVDMQLKNIQYSKIPVKYWLIPSEKNKFIVIKANNEQ